jgi:hypothetical protein
MIERVWENVRLGPHIHMKGWGLIGKLVGDLWFAWGMGWRISQWWHMMRQMGDGTYEV